ncbi:ABC transporter permease [Pedobacter psychroterrae]|uniref:FtsX-like permease family protein n=1 Tax=Pedobacter psychroterrae TaxID=2530453 RepID=A0A4R0NRX2_9SPHI|nr:ABC transporter permease [Pedobacter psychroterrae]TCD02869.1 FtsX-like permease family protein [Pedobacter psychroterrae]
MILHLFKMILNRKKTYFFLFLQLFVAFMAMFLVMGLNMKKFSNYFQPLGYTYEDVWLVEPDFQNVPEDKKAEYSSLILDKLRAIKEVEVVSAAQVIPFQQWGSEEKITYKKQVITALKFEVDEHYQDVMGIGLVEGRWFTAKDYVLNSIPVVISRDLAERDFKNESALGKTILIGDKTAQIIGVSEAVRENSSANLNPGFFMPLQTAAGKYLLKSENTENFQLLEDKVRKSVTSVGAADIRIKQNISLGLIKKYAHKTDYIQLSITFVVFVFLLINVFLGISGMFSYNLSKRKAEVGLRVILGASPGQILMQFLGESMVLTTLGILPGVLIAVQMLIMQYFEPYTNEYYGILSIMCSAMFLYLLMLSCAFYPSLKATRLNPSDALHEE